MKKMFQGSLAALTLAAVAATLFVVPTLAADMPLKARPLPPPPAFSWQGCFVGVQGGGAWGRSRHDGFAPGPTVLTPYFDLTGAAAGIEYGCNFKVGEGWVIGTESDFSWTDKRGSSNDTGPGGNPTFVSTTREHWFSTSRLRVGRTFDRTLIYVTGGVAVARAEGDLQVPGLGQFSETRTLWGATVGGGVEQALTDKWSLKVDYLYMNFENRDLRFGNDARVVALNAQRSGLNLSDHIFRAGINYKFSECFLFCAPVTARY
jgi:outer membrane immunogenic protein